MSGMSVLFQAYSVAINPPCVERFGRFPEASMISGIGCIYRQHLIDEWICPDSRVPVPVIE
jgi:hypothetical protein